MVCEQDIPSSDPTISADDVNSAYDAEEGTINYTINNPVEGGSIVASTEAEWLMVDDEAQTDAEGSIYFYCGANSNFYAHSATVTLTYTYDDSKATVTKIVTVTQALNPDANGSTIDYPIMVSEAIDAIDEVVTVSNIYVGGIVSNIETEYSSQYHNITFDMIDEEGNEYFLRAYRCGGNEAANVTVGDEVIVYGNLIKYGEIYEFAQGCEVVSLIHPAVPTIAVSPVLVELDAEEHDGTLALAYENLTITDMTDFEIQFCDANGDELSEEPDWIEVLVAGQDPEIGEGYVVSYNMVENEGAARMAYFKVYAMDDETNIVYSNLVTISQAAYVAPPTPGNWVLTNLADLTSADVFVIVGTRTDATYGGNYAMSNDKGASSAPDAVAVVVVDETLSGEIPANIQWNISGNATDGYTFYPAGESSKWLYCINDNNGVRVGTNSNKAFEVENGYLKNSATSRFVGVYNAQDWRCYANTNGNIKDQTFAFYKKVADYPVTYTKQIAQHGGTTDAGGWHLIAPPVASVTPSTENGFISTTAENYDLYCFDQSADKEWKNYKQNSFNLVSGKGYLYANGDVDGTTLSFTGQPYNGNGVVDLVYSEDNEDANMHGWNLIGNPFSTAATLNMPFFKMNGTGSGFTSQNANSSVAAMEGVLVYAYDDVALQPIPTATFTAAGRSNSESAAMVNIDVVSSFGDVMDNAIVNFNEGIHVALQPIPTATFTAAGRSNSENVEFSYLHLIDNMTGTDIDLLQTPNYTFESRTTDYTSRFRLVFGANGASAGSASDETFAYFNGSEWMINNSGNATLQVVDVMGRVLSSEAVNGSVSKAINTTAGVYMLRLVSGNDVKTQKIVVR